MTWGDDIMELLKSPEGADGMTASEVGEALSSKRPSNTSRISQTCRVLERYGLTRKAVVRRPSTSQPAFLWIVPERCVCTNCHHRGTCLGICVSGGCEKWFPMNRGGPKA